MHSERVKRKKTMQRNKISDSIQSVMCTRLFTPHPSQGEIFQSHTEYRNCPSTTVIYTSQCRTRYCDEMSVICKCWASETGVSQNENQRHENVSCQITASRSSLLSRSSTQTSASRCSPPFLHTPSASTKVKVNVDLYGASSWTHL